jgi:hypothetical protein
MGPNETAKIQAEHAFQCERLAIKTFVDYFTETGLEPTCEDELVSIQLILNLEIAVYLLKRKSKIKEGSPNGGVIDTLLEKREEQIEKHDMLFETAYIELNQFYNV